VVVAKKQNMHERMYANNKRIREMSS
jgi:hypothetical protein